MVSQLRSGLQSLATDPAKYSLHSLRSGGAPSAAAVPSVTRDELKRHGRWASSVVCSRTYCTLAGCVPWYYTINDKFICSIRNMTNVTHIITFPYRSVGDFVIVLPLFIAQRHVCR